jgi:hypothetical protein
MIYIWNRIIINFCVFFSTYFFSHLPIPPFPNSPDCIYMLFPCSPNCIYRSRARKPHGGRQHQQHQVQEEHAQNHRLRTAGSYIILTILLSYSHTATVILVLVLYKKSMRRTIAYVLQGGCYLDVILSVFPSRTPLPLPTTLLFPPKICVTQ